MSPPRKSELSEDEQLSAFLQHWVVVRTGLIKKYEEKIEWWARKYPDQPALMSDRRKLEHYQHELHMLELLQKRAFGASS